MAENFSNLLGTVTNFFNPFGVSGSFASGEASAGTYESGKAEFKTGLRVIYHTRYMGPVPGIVRWCGANDYGEPCAGIEFEKAIGNFSGIINGGQEIFRCRPKHGIVVPIKQLQMDKNLKIECYSGKSQYSKPNCQQVTNAKKGQLDLSTGVEFIVFKIELDDFVRANGPKGIQGVKNSCYLDSMLTSLFAFTDIFDECLLLNSSKYRSTSDGSKYDEDLADKTAILLGKYIANPLRSQYYCPARPVLELRSHLYHLNAKLKFQFMDVEEMMFLLFENVFNLKGFLTFDSGDTDFIMQLTCIEAKRKAYVISTQRLLELTMQSLGMKLRTMPVPAFILQMPRSNGKLMGDLRAILPSLTLDITNLIPFDGGNQKCWICSRPAFYECKECFDTTVESGAGSTFFCCACWNPYHMHDLRKQHRKYNGAVVKSYYDAELQAELIAVICYQYYHFVSFCRTKSGDWVFFDSNPNGNSPHTEVLRDFDDKIMALTGMTEAEIILKLDLMPPMLQRILTDSHICIYGPRITQKSNVRQIEETSI